MLPAVTGICAPTMGVISREKRSSGADVLVIGAI